MKRVDALEILGNPRKIDLQVGCPQCQERAMAFSDGSIICIYEGGLCFAPEPPDRDLYKLRQRFDQENGITPAARQKVPSAIRSGMALPLSEFKDK
jgi:hypothetical protein